jgi:hypothetical protein
MANEQAYELSKRLSPTFVHAELTDRYELTVCIWRLSERADEI